VAGTWAALACRLGRGGGVVVFQGDSITAAGRSGNVTAVNDPRALGTGYPRLVAEGVLRTSPAGRWRFFNRAITGSRVPDLAARWERDALALEPDVLSVLVGVNDFWHRHDGYAGTVSDYEVQYRDLLERTYVALPSARLVVLEPFVLRCGVVTASWFPEFDERRAAAARVARDARVTFIPLQAAFDARAARTGPEHWAPDGIHPSAAGHAVIAEHWRAGVGV
jgi:lysophospholipase L1-like esterase